jgi:hypothetical protein
VSPSSAWYPYVGLFANDCFCGEQLSGAWELKFETSKSGSLIIPAGDWGRVSAGLLVIRTQKDDS